MAGFFPFSLTNGLMSSPTPTAPVQQDLLSYTGDGSVQNSRYINPLTNDFQLNSNHQLLGQNATDQSVLLTLTTTFNSSSVNGLGNNFGSVKLIGNNIRTQMTNILNQALGSLIANGNIIVKDVQIIPTNNNSVGVSFTYYNQSVNANRTIQFTQQNGLNLLNG
jgi:hypothetical protein